MKWRRRSSESSVVLWTIAWWLEDAEGNTFQNEGEDLYICKLRGEKGYFICSFPIEPNVEFKPKVEFGPFPTLRLAKLTYQLVASAQ